MEETDWSLVAGMIEGDEHSWDHLGRQSKPLVLVHIRRTFAELNYNPPSIDVHQEITSAVYSLFLAHDKLALDSFQGRSRLST